MRPLNVVGLQISDVAIATFDYTGGVRSGELKLTIGDKVLVLEQASGDAQGWWRG